MMLCNDSCINCAFVLNRHVLHQADFSASYCTLTRCIIYCSVSCDIRVVTVSLINYSAVIINMINVCNMKVCMCCDTAGQVMMKTDDASCCS